MYQSKISNHYKIKSIFNCRVRDKNKTCPIMANMDKRAYYCNAKT